MNQKNNIHISFFFLLSLGFLAGADSQKSDESWIPSFVKKLEAIAPGEQAAEQAVAAIHEELEYRSKIIEKLIKIVDPGNKGQYAIESRQAAAVMLGHYRAPEAVSVLARCVREEPWATTSLSMLNRPYTNALVSIGDVAIPGIIDAVGHPDTSGFEFVTAYSLVKLGCTSKQIRQLLLDGEKRAKTPAAVKQYQAAIKQTNEMIEAEESRAKSKQMEGGGADTRPAH